MKLFKFSLVLLIILPYFLFSQNKSLVVLYHSENDVEPVHQIALKMKKIGDENGIQVTLFNIKQLNSKNVWVLPSSSHLTLELLTLSNADALTSTGSKILFYDSNANDQSSRQIAQKIKEFYGGDFFSEVLPTTSSSIATPSSPFVSIHFMLNNANQKLFSSLNGQEEIAQRLFKAVYRALN